MSVVDQKLADLNREIAFWKSQIVAEPHRADRLLDRLSLLIRERDHLMTLTPDERAKAHELSQMMDALDVPGQVPDQATMDEYVAIQERYSAIVEVTA